MKQMICVEAIQYPPGVFIKEGQKFDVHEEDIHVLTLAGKIKQPAKSKADKQQQKETAEA